jgi:CRISPR/Cas system-associated exonuclease Cas4 (RecB family)
MKTKNVDKVRLSYSMMNELFLCPHTYINKINGLKRYTNQAMKDGTQVHRIIQEHVSGKTKNELLKDLPLFEKVETKDLDEKMKVEFHIDDKYYFVGYVDGLDPKTGRMLEIKSGKKWSIGDFNRLMQWRLYSYVLPHYKTVYMVNTPRKVEEWSEYNVNVYQKDVTEKDIEMAKKYIDKAIYTIEHIGEQELYGKNWACNYIDCEFCKE